MSQDTPTTPAPQPHADWKVEGERLFGPDVLAWRFRCPVCQYVYTVSEGQAAQMKGAIGFSCIGRYLPSARKASGGRGQGPCDYAGGGLFKLNPRTVVMDDGSTIQAMDFAPMQGSHGD